MKLITELCQNHNGKEKILFSMLDEAVEAGATHVKLQHIFSENITYRKIFENGGLDKVSRINCFKRPYEDEYKRLKKLEIKHSTVKKFIKECEAYKVTPLTTCFAHQHAHELHDIGFDEIKVASYDCASFSMLETLKNLFKKIYISTGATFDSEVEKASKILGKKATFFHCVTRYPTPLEHLNLNRIEYLRKFSKRVGYSDHSSTMEIPNLASYAAIYNGASLIERHFTILPKDQTKDGKVSINPSDIKDLFKFYKLSKEDQLKILKRLGYSSKFLGKRTFEMSNEEYSNRLYYRGRFASVITENGIKRHVYNWE
tara:strand:- start:12456 stop:13400 length:945 start_codon:yes stop_codon:yes gene_type:complete